MVAILDEAEVRQRVRPLPVEAYQQLVEWGIAGERVELLRGIIFNKVPKTPRHSVVTGRLEKTMEAQLPPGLHLRKEEPLTFADSEPEPDLAIVPGQIQDYAVSHPLTALLVVEVALSSLHIDRQKAALYAEAGVAEYWLVAPETKSIEVYTSPLGGQYQSRRLADPEAELRSVVIPEVAISPRELFS